MIVGKSTGILLESMVLGSENLKRDVKIDFYTPSFLIGGNIPLADVNLLLINDGQELDNLGFYKILDDLNVQGRIEPMICVGIHAGPDRLKEYGTIDLPDYLDRGDQAGAYGRFVIDELMPVIRRKFQAPSFKEKAFAGFSLGALSAMDIVWHYPKEFARAGLFSGSFWWRSKDKADPAYNENTDRIMQRLVREGEYHPWLRFFFECGTDDEREDRNGNGVIDSIDDTMDLIRELRLKGYTEDAIKYVEIPGGRHEVGTWGEAMPGFLQWGWGR